VTGLLSPRTWLCGLLLGVWADVGAAPGDGEDQSFVAEDLDRSQDRVTAYIVLLLELFDRWQGAAPGNVMSHRFPDDNKIVYDSGMGP
jgi:hypothetical protein